MRKRRMARECLVAIPVLAVVAIGVLGYARQAGIIPQEPDLVDGVAYPEDYRNWTHVKSMAILEGHENYHLFGGIHHVYANDKALAALKESTPFTDGAVLVFDLLEEQFENNAVTEGPRKVIGVMEKDSERFADTEGWGFEDFRAGDPGQRSVTDMRSQCLSCHESRASTGYVYSIYRE